MVYLELTEKTQRHVRFLGANMSVCNLDIVELHSLFRGERRTYTRHNWIARGLGTVS